MNHKKIITILNEIEEIDEESGSESIYVAGKVSEKEILFVEKRLSVKFCSEYKEFIMHYGAVSRSQEYLTGIWPGQPDLDSEGTILYHHMAFEEHAFKLGNKTILNPGGEEFYRIIDHDTSELFTYDRFSKKYEPAKDSISEYIVNYFEMSLELAKI